MTPGHPGQLPYGPNYPRGAKPPLPQTVQNAFYLMLAGAVLQLTGVIVAMTQIGRMRDAFAQSSGSAPDANTMSGVFVVMILVLGGLEIALWIWMAYKNKAGRQWARVVATVLFGLSCLGVVSSVLTLAFRSSINSLNSNTNPDGTHTTSVSVSGSTTVVGTVVTVLAWGVGLAAIILLYRRQSSDYFAPTPAYGYAGPPGAPGYGFPPQPYPPQAYTVPGPPPVGYNPQGYAADRRPEPFTPPPAADAPPTEPGTAQDGFHPPA